MLRTSIYVCVSGNFEAGDTAGGLFCQSMQREPEHFACPFLAICFKTQNVGLAEVSESVFDTSLARPLQYVSKYRI